ncbi:MAG: tetratricopeptide repeat protein [Bacteroidetes bacterium]|uniref:Tetratricopeptide repeat protein n=1 Tax=Candidatus Egerieousia excrementavium TaxID=2840778 RepID=A0A9D9DL39_9BACT|nr:tetratricopeptide repeat protein [Candidatus Egerieousia excrementavium]
MMISLKGFTKTTLLTLLILALSWESTQAQDIIDSISIAKNLKNENFLDAVRAYNDNRLEKAQDLFYKVLNIDPDNDASYYYLANIALKNKDIPTGELLLRKAIGIDSSNYWYKDLQARIMITSNRLDEAIEAYENLITEFPSRTNIYYTLINLYMSRNDIEKSRQTLDKIETIAGRNESTALARFNIYSVNREWTQAVEYLVDFDREIQSAKIETLIGDLYTNMYKDSLALAYYNKALRTSPDYDLARFGIAELYRRAGNYDMYFKYIIPFLSNPNLNRDILSDYLKRILSTPGFMTRHKEQLDTLMSQCAQSHATDSTITYICATYFSQSGKPERGLELLKDNADLYPNDIRAFFTYLSLLFYTEEWDTVERECKAALEKFNNNPDILQALGLSYYHNEMYDKAIATYQSLVNTLKSKGDTTFLVSAYTTLADLYHEAGESKQAYSNYEKALKLDNTYLPALNNYAYYLSLQNKQLKKALAMSKITIEKEPDNPTYVDTYAWILYLTGRYPEAKAMLKHAMLYGGTESGDILDHYAEVLYALKEYDLAFIYWEQARDKEPELDLTEKIKQRKAAIGR